MFRNKSLFQFGLRLFFHFIFHTNEHLSPGLSQALFWYPPGYTEHPYQNGSIIMQVPIFLHAHKIKLNSMAFLLWDKRKTVGLPLHSSDTDFTYTHICVSSLLEVSASISHIWNLPAGKYEWMDGWIDWWIDCLQLPQAFGLRAAARPSQEILYTKLP